MRAILILILLLLLPMTAGAQAQPAAPAADDRAALAKQLSNPISQLVSVPFQFNWEQGVGPKDQTRLVLNVQPVMPFSINEDWNLIARVIVPFISQPPLSDSDAPAFGISDVLASAFISPTKGTFVWGIGPVFALPSTTMPTLGTEKWSAGPTIVALKQSGPWTYGVLWNQIWSFAGNPARGDISQMYLQPFLSHTNARALTVGLASEATANWKAADHQWTVPAIVSVSKLSSFGTFPASYQIGVGIYTAKPEIGPTWKLRTAITILLPRK